MQGTARESCLGISEQKSTPSFSEQREYLAINETAVKHYIINRQAIEYLSLNYNIIIIQAFYQMIIVLALIC